MLSPDMPHEVVLARPRLLPPGAALDRAVETRPRVALDGAVLAPMVPVEVLHGGEEHAASLARMRLSMIHGMLPLLRSPLRQQSAEGKIIIDNDK